MICITRLTHRAALQSFDSSVSYNLIANTNSVRVNDSCVNFYVTSARFRLQDRFSAHEIQTVQANHPSIEE